MDKHEKYGELRQRLKPLPFVFFPQIIFGLGLFAGGAIWLSVSIAGGSFAFLSILLIIAGVLLMVYALYSLNKCGVFLYDTAIVAKEALKTVEMEIADMRAMQWSFPGANDVNSRAPRKNNTSCEVVMQIGKKGYRISDAFYGAKIVDILSGWQHLHNIPKDIVDKKSSGKRY